METTTPSIGGSEDAWSRSGHRTITSPTPKGDHLVEGDARRKLLSIQPHKDVSTTVQVKFVTEGTWKTDGTPDGKDGFSVWELGSGQALRALPHEYLESLVKTFLAPE